MYKKFYEFLQENVEDPYFRSLHRKILLSGLEESILFRCIFSLIASGDDSEPRLLPYDGNNDEFNKTLTELIKAVFCSVYTKYATALNERPVEARSNRNFQDLLSSLTIKRGSKIQKLLIAHLERLINKLTYVDFIRSLKKLKDNLDTPCIKDLYQRIKEINEGGTDRFRKASDIISLIKAIELIKEMPFQEDQKEFNTALSTFMMGVLSAAMTSYHLHDVDISRENGGHNTVKIELKNGVHSIAYFERLLEYYFFNPLMKSSKRLIKAVPLNTAMFSKDTDRIENFDPSISYADFHFDADKERVDITITKEGDILFFKKNGDEVCSQLLDTHKINPVFVNFFRSFLPQRAEAQNLYTRIAAMICFLECFIEETETKIEVTHSFTIDITDERRILFESLLHIKKIAYEKEGHRIEVEAPDYSQGFGIFKHTLVVTLPIRVENTFTFSDFTREQILLAVLERRGAVVKPKEKSPSLFRPVHLSDRSDSQSSQTAQPL